VHPEKFLRIGPGYYHAYYAFTASPVQTALSNAAIYVRPPVCSMLIAQNGAFYGYGYYRTFIENPMLEVESTD